jgi:uncharacterized membrane protein
MLLPILQAQGADDAYPYEGIVGGFFGSWTFFLICAVLLVGVVVYWWKFKD